MNQNAEITQSKEEVEYLKLLGITTEQFTDLKLSPEMLILRIGKKVRDDLKEYHKTNIKLSAHVISLIYKDMEKEAPSKYRTERTY